MKRSILTATMIASLGFASLGGVAFAQSNLPLVPDCQTLNLKLDAEVKTQTDGLALLEAAKLKLKAELDAAVLGGVLDTIAKAQAAVDLNAEQIIKAKAKLKIAVELAAKDNCLGIPGTPGTPGAPGTPGLPGVVIPQPNDSPQFDLVPNTSRGVNTGDGSTA